MAAVPTCAVLCIVNDSEGGEPVPGAKVEATLSTYEVYQGYVVPHKTVGVTDATGACTLDLWPNQLGAVESEYLIKITALGKTLKTTAVIPSQPACNLWEVAGLPVYDGLDNGSLIIGQVLAAKAAAEAARDVAVGAAGTATTQAGIATGAASTATTQAGIATGAASSASTSATNAGDSATLAQNWATKTDGPVAGGEYSAKYWAQSIAGGPVASWVGLTGVISFLQARTVLSITNVDNTSDANKPISSAAATALAGKEPTITAGSTAQYWRGDKSWQTLNKAAVGLPNVDNTSDASKPLSTAATTALAGKEPTIAGGSTAQYWRGDKSWQTLDKTAVGLPNVDNTSDANKPVSPAQATAIGSKSDTATTVTKDSGTGAANMPVGTTAQRGTGVTGKLRFNSTTGRWEGYGAAAWGTLGGASGGGNDAIFYESDAVMTSDYAIPSGRNAMLAGPITINPGVTLDIAAGSTLTIV